MRREGFFSLYKGFLPTWFRMVLWFQICSFKDLFFFVAILTLFLLPGSLVFDFLAYIWANETSNGHQLVLMILRGGQRVLYLVPLKFLSWKFQYWVTHCRTQIRGRLRKVVLITVCLGENDMAWQSFKSVYKNVNLPQKVVHFFF